MKLGIDIGNYNVKTSEGIIFKSAISENIEFGNHFDKIEIYNKVYYIGTGKLEVDYRKFDKDNYEPLLLAAICKSSNSVENTIGLGLPIKQYYVFKDELRNKLVNKAPIKGIIVVTPDSMAINRKYGCPIRKYIIKYSNISTKIIK